MKYIDIIRMAYGNLLRRKMRAILTIVGVFIGTMAIVVMMSLGIGLKETTEKQMEMWGDINIITIEQGRGYNPKTGEYRGKEQRLNDAAVARAAGEEGVLAVMPIYKIDSEAKYGKKVGALSVCGVAPELFAQMKYKVKDGRMLEKGDSNNVLVGWQVANAFYEPDKEAPDFSNLKNSLEMLNKITYMEVHNSYDNGVYKKLPLTVVGVLEGEYKDHAFNVYAPIDDVVKWRELIQDKKYMSAEQRANEQRAEQEALAKGKRQANNKRDPKDYDSIMVNCQNVLAARRLAESLREEGYSVNAMADSMEEVEKQSKVIQAVLGGIGSITLLVASIGIANTMIMAINERTKEIGVMKVIGATGGDILGMFLMEAGMIGICGGILGLICSLGVSKVINHFSANFMGGDMGLETGAMGISMVPPYLMVFALIFAFMIGIIAGIYPAWRASKLKPITAIRGE
ncbi:MAG: ABC transporter permease [Peptococcaceae bacterium]|jgi:ABC-type antimicrobial peptide transport system permease subunit|nr:ABC transporter permease [Peptococcaceae bacterium]